MAKLNPATAITGRVKTFLNNPEMGTLPVSCTVIDAQLQTSEGVQDLITFVSKALRTGAGINVHVDDIDNVVAKEGTGDIFLFAESSDTEDFKKLSESQYFTNFLERDDKVIIVSDSMEEDGTWFKFTPVLADVNYIHGDKPKSIEKCIFYAYLAGVENQTLVFNLSGIRPSGIENSEGMVSSGMASFGFILAKAFEFGNNPNIKTLLSFLSSFNQELRRGGKYKNGAITTSYPIYGKYAKEYLNLPAITHPWLKKGLVLTSDFLTFAHLISDIIYSVNAGVLWLEKAVIQGSSLEQPFLWLSSKSELLNERLKSNVCREILIPSKGTCNLSHVNLAHYSCTAEIVTAFEDSMTFLCDLHAQDNQSQAGIYLPANEDRQVGLGVIGLANILALSVISYEDFTHTLASELTYENKKAIYDYVNRKSDRLPFQTEPLKCCNDTECLVHTLFTAYAKAGRIAKDRGMKRAFCIAPTASSSFKYFDYEGNTTTPEISPPVYQVTERLSETDQSEEIFYYGDVETAEKVGFKVYKELVNAWQELINSTGLAHSISFNIWEDIDRDFLQWFFLSSTLTTYYRLNVRTGHLNKADQFNQCSVCAG